MMTLNEAIRHVEEVVNAHEEKLKTYEDLGEDRVLFEQEEASCRSCAEDHKQLAGWLKELKQLREQKSCGDAISRQAVLDIWHTSYSDNREENEEIQYKKIAFELPSVNPQEKTGHWINIDDCEHFIAKCSECGRIEDSRMVDIYPYCHCGAKMVEPQERSE